MKKYTISLREHEARFYTEIAQAVERPVEEILSDTLVKVLDLIARETCQ